MSKYKVRAVRWEHGWELHVEGVGVTQVRTLNKAEQQVRDFLETMTDEDATDAEVIVTPDLGDLGESIRQIHRDEEAARKGQAAAASAMRAVVQELRVRQRLSLSDTAKVLGVSRGRVSQLTSTEKS